jgi:hypothetical protein
MKTATHRAEFVSRFQRARFGGMLRGKPAAGRRVFPNPAQHFEPWLRAICMLTGSVAKFPRPREAKL